MNSQACVIAPGDGLPQLRDDRLLPGELVEDAHRRSVNWLVDGAGSMVRDDGEGTGRRLGGTRYRVGEDLPDLVLDLLGDLLGRRGRVEHEVPVRLRAGQHEEPGPDPAVKLNRLGLDPVGRAGMPAAPDLRRHVEQHREVGRPPVGRPAVQPRDVRRRDAPPGALVGERGVDVPVGDHDRAALQGRVDDLGHVLGPVGGVQQGLAVRRHAGVSGVEQQRAQPHPDLGRARLVAW